MIKKTKKNKKKNNLPLMIGTEFLTMISEYIKNVTMNHEDVKYPTPEDLTGAAQALTRLQETYHLDVKDLSEGLLNGVAYRYVCASHSFAKA